MEENVMTQDFSETHKADKQDPTTFGSYFFLTCCFCRTNQLPLMGLIKFNKVCICVCKNVGMSLMNCYCFFTVNLNVHQQIP